MSTVPSSKRYVAHVVMWVGLVLALPLWREFHEPSQPVWNVLLGAFLLALVIGSFFGVRFMQNHEVEVGEARFTNVNGDMK